MASHFGRGNCKQSHNFLSRLRLTTTKDCESVPAFPIPVPSAMHSWLEQAAYQEPHNGAKKPERQRPHGGGHESILPFQPAPLQRGEAHAIAAAPSTLSSWQLFLLKGSVVIVQALTGTAGVMARLSVVGHQIASL